MRRVFWVISIWVSCVWGWIPQAVADAGNPPRKTRILLTFDDGPAIGVTDIVLEELDRRGIKSAFFLLTGPEKLVSWIPWGKTYTRAESQEGFETVVEEIRRGHMIGCHWGGRYGSQRNGHPPRLLEPSYDSTGDGVVDKLSEKGNALESDLIHCRDTLNAALEQANMGEREPDVMMQSQDSLSYIRPPVWNYKSKDGTLDARPTYELFHWEMILSDTKLNDGETPIQGFPVSRRMNSEIIKAIENGQSEVIVTMHDSNIRTANDLPGILDRLEKRLKNKGLIQGLHWDYTRTVSEVAAAMEGYIDRTDHN